MLSFLLACAVLVAPFASNASWGYVQAAAAESDGEVDYSTEYVVLSLEGFTLGQGFYIEPERMSYKEIGEVWKEEGIDIDLSKLTVSQATYAFFKKEGLETEPSGTDKYNSSSYYLANVKGIDKGAANVPQELKDAYQKKNGKALELKDKTGKDLGQFDYFSMSGWMNTVDNIMGNVGAGEYQVDSAAGVDNTHVIRWQFTLADYGADLGYGYNPDKNTFDSEYAYYETQDKTELYVLYAEHADEIAKDEALREEVQAVMTDLTATADEVQAVEKKISGDKRNTVSVTMNYSAPYMTLADSEGNEIEVGEPDGSKYTLELEPGTYRLSAYQKSGDEKTDMGSIDLVVTDDPQQSYSIYSITDIACTGYDTVDGNKKYWKEDVDYTVTGKVMSPDNVDRHAEFVKTREGSDGAWAKYAGLFYYADMVSVTYDPVGDRADDYISKTVSNTLTSNRSYGYSVALAAAKTVEFTVPEGTELRVGTLSTYYIYKDEAGIKIDSKDAGYDTYKYNLGSGITYYYRVTGGEGVTYWNWFSTTTDAEYKVTAEDMYIGDSTYGPGTVVHDMSANSSDVADIYMTSNEKGYIAMQKGDKYHLECFRNWQAIEGIMNAKSAEPDYHYTVIDENGNPSSDVISVVPGEHSEIAEIEAKSEGTAILLVTYDAEINKPGMGGSFFSAIWPENTGVVVFTVGNDGSDIQTNMTLNAGRNTETAKTAVDNLDAQIDVLYYLEGAAGAEYTFTPEDGVAVSVLHPQITGNKLTYSGFTTADVKKNDDGSYTVSGLTEGSNIIKVTKDGVSTYQVVRAKEVPVSYTYKNADGDEISADELRAGDTIEVSYGKRTEDGKKAYDGLYIPANKLAGIYNMAGTIKLSDGEGNEFSGASNQYAFASYPAAQTVTVKIPQYFAGDEYTLSGVLYEGGFGSPYGSHREVRHATGKPVQMAASVRVAYLGSLPDMSFKLAKTDFVQVKLDVVDGATNEAVEGYKVSIKDTEGNPVTVKDGSFNGLAGRQYNYTMKCAGYMYAEGTFEIPEDTSGEMSQTISLTASSATAWDGESKTEPEQVDGVYQISTGAELYWFENEVNVNKKVDINAVLTADINLAGYSWTPIGTSGAIYMGSFDGQGHTISNLYQNDIGYSGIFGQAGARISSLTVEGTIIMSTKTAAGAVVGYLYQGTTDAPARVAGCTSKVNITYTGTNTSASIGGLVGYCNTNKISNTVIENCVNHGTIKAENGGTVGGIIGSMSSRNICVQNSTNYGDITAKTNVGGILGSHNEYYPQDPGCKIISCYNAGTITGQTNAGGIAGVFKGNTSNDAGVEITDCYSAGTVNGSDTATTGVFAGYSEDLTISGSAYSCTAAADESITEDQASYVSAANIEAVKKLTVDTVTKINDGEAILNVAPAAEIMANVPLTAEDGEFVETYKKVRTVIDGVTIFNIGVYDYTASAAGINGASKDGVILENTKVEAASAVDAVKRALDNAGIAYDIQESAYGPYIVSVNGLASVADYSMSGWMLSYNGDDFDNGGLGSLDAKDNDTIELHYELTGADVAASFSGLPTFESMTIDGTEITFTTETETDENWNSIYTYKANGEVLNGTGTKADPFEVGVVLPESADLVKLDMTYKTTADGHYVVVDGLSAKINLTNDVVCRITSRGGRTAWYKIMAVTALTEDNTKLEIADAEYTGEELTPEVTVYVNDKKLDPSSYEVTYSDNVNAGKGTCTVKGTGKFSGTIQGEFEIKKSTKTITTEKTEIEVLENEEPFDLEVTGQGTLTFASSAPEVAEVDPETGRVTVKAVGETEITVSSEGTENYEVGQIVIKITVKEVPVEPEEPDTKVTLTKDNTVIEVADVTYTGKAQKPEVTVTVDGKKLEAADYTASYANNVNAGTAKVTITGKNDYTGSVEQTFKINKADQTVTGNTLYVYNRYITVKAAGKGTVTYSSTNKNIAIVNSKSGLVRTKKPGRVQIKITVSGNSNYNKASGIVTLIVTPAKSSITKLASNSSRSLKVTYKKVSGATGYQITYATNKNFKSAKTKYVSAKYGSATIKNLAKNKRYYVRVRAYKTINGKRYMGLGSSVKSVKVK